MVISKMAAKMAAVTLKLAYLLNYDPCDLDRYAAVGESGEEGRGGEVSREVDQGHSGALELHRRLR